MSLLPMDEALSQLLTRASVLPAERVPLAQAHGRILAHDTFALRTQPPFPASAMDGYSVRHADLALGKPLAVIGQSAAGHPFKGSVGQGQAVRIFTGAVVPDGADTILIQENAHLLNDAIVPTEMPALRNYVRAAGLDFHAGDLVASAGSVLTPQLVALLASANYAFVDVHTKPRIGILATGDELRLPGQTLGPGEIIASNSFGLAALIEQHGGVPVDLGIAADNHNSLRAYFENALSAKCDVIVTLGGASVGDHDLVQPVLVSMGMKLDFWKIAMRPGKPLMVGTLGDVIVLGLPGNPVSAMVCGQLFLAPLMNTMMGNRIKATTLKARLNHDLAANGNRRHYMRGLLRYVNGEPTVEVFDNQDSSLLSILAKANCLVVRPIGDEARSKGEKVDIQLI